MIERNNTNVALDRLFEEVFAMIAGGTHVPLSDRVIVDEVESSGEFKRKSLFLIMVKYIAPICIVAILVFSVLEGLGFITV